ncbi:MAG: hypothetical protein CMG59_06170 [Candidatus Marinimicrobia bacterium]|nr:hypothetical protein [Candidatus Neomarinimicrobiota bacterium]|tara:strand:+ start:1557 stop:1991 length:435 start_codon:yes stop_codon:yes gene_type:complete
MVKWNKENFIKTVKTNCFGHTTNVIVDLVNFSEDTADNLQWGKGENCGTMTYKCKSEDYGLVPLFNITTNGKIKFHINHMRDRVEAKEIIKDYQIKLEANFLMDFDSELYPSDLSHKIEDLFNIKTEVDHFQDTIAGISARLKQ